MVNYRDEEERDISFQHCDSRCSSCGYKEGRSCLLTQIDAYSRIHADQIAAKGRPVPLHCPNNFKTPSAFREKPIQTVGVEGDKQKGGTKTGKNKNKAKPPNVHFI